MFELGLCVCTIIVASRMIGLDAAVLMLPYTHTQYMHYSFIRRRDL